MELNALLEPLYRLREVALSDKTLKDIHYLFGDFYYHFLCYVNSRDENSFHLLSSDEVACISRFDERDQFLNECLLVILDIMEAVKIDSCGDNANEEEKQRAHQLIEAAIEELNRITFYEEDDPDFDEFNN